MRSRRRFWGLLLVIELIVVVLHLPSLTAPHNEGDEVVLTFLSERLRVEPLRYSVQGFLEGESARRFVADTWTRTYAAIAPPERDRALHALEKLDRVELVVDPIRARQVYDPEIYDRPVFLHPPAYPLALTAFRSAFGTAGGPLLSILFHVTTVLALAVVGRMWLGPTVGLLAGSLVAIDPVTWLAGHHLWTDGMLETNVVIAMLAAEVALRSGRAGAFAGAGTVFGLACVTKMPAILVSPAILTAFVVHDKRPGTRQVLAFAAGSLALLLPWLIFFRSGYGAWLPVTRPTEWLQATYPYVRMMAARPWHFYVTGLLLVAPVTLFALPGIATSRRDRRLLTPVTWAAVPVVVLTVLGLAGHGMQLRYLAPAMPALCLLAAAGIARSRRRAWMATAVVLAAVTFVSALFNAGMAEPFPTALVYAAGKAGLPVERWLAGMW